MIHGAFFRSLIPTVTPPAEIRPVDPLDGNVREFLEQSEAYLVGVSAYGANLQYVKISNDLWNSRESLYVPALGTYDSGNAIWWLPSPKRVIVGSLWTVNGYQDLGADEYENVILYLSYSPVVDVAPPDGIISRQIIATATPTGVFTELDTIADLDPSKNYYLIGCSGGLTAGSIALRVRVDSFQGLTPVFPAVSDVAKGTQRMINELPEGLLISGKEPITVDIYQSAADVATVYVFLAQEEVI